jgi:hypothetical protein
MQAVTNSPMIKQQKQQKGKNIKKKQQKQLIKIKCN